MGQVVVIKIHTVMHLINYLMRLHMMKKEFL